MPLPAAFSLQDWIEENRHLLKPPVGNKTIVQEDFIVMIVGGPNARTDYHFEDGPEWFYQLEGEMVLRIQEHPTGGLSRWRCSSIQACRLSGAGSMAGSCGNAVTARGARISGSRGPGGCGPGRRRICPSGSRSNRCPCPGGARGRP